MRYCTQIDVAETNRIKMNHLMSWLESIPEYTKDSFGRNQPRWKIQRMFETCCGSTIVSTTYSVEFQKRADAVMFNLRWL